MQALGPQYLDLFFYNAAGVEEYRRLIDSAGFTDEEWAKGQSHAPLLSAIYESQLELLPEISAPSLLVHGVEDLVAPPQVIRAYSKHVRNGRVHTFTGSSHFAFCEEPDAYTKVIQEFVCKSPRSTA